MKIAYRFGHMMNCDQGASGIVLEYNFNRQYGAKVVEFLSKVNGIELMNCTPVSANSMSESLSYGVNKANAFGADLFISFHANCYNGTANGSEVVCGSQTGITIGNRILNNLSGFGFKNRSAYLDRRGLYEIRHTNMPCIIIEPLFIDSQTDMNIFNSIGLDAFSKAIAEGILGQSINTTPTNGWYQDSSTKIWYYYQNGTLIKNGWIKYKEKWFAFNDKGQMIQSGWFSWKNNWFYLNDKGEMVTNCWEQDSSKRWFYLGSDGIMLRDTVTPDGSKVGSDGAKIN